MSNESALEHEDVAATEQSYQLTPATSEHLSQLIGAQVRVLGTISHVAPAVTPATGRAAGGRGQATPAPAVDQRDTSSVQKLSDRCDAQLTMFAM
ncbi:MAG TPA: hypothetical protein VHZ73_01770 [Vicinamibacterales bacterium]|nr:hypothetical protein [Vicinamibacterales bacterium]